MDKKTRNQLVKRVLNFEHYWEDLGEKRTIRSYFIELIKRCWVLEDDFSGKRPFGNGGWKQDVFAALGAGGFIVVRYEDGEVYDYDEVTGNSIIMDIFEYLSHETK